MTYKKTVKKYKNKNTSTKNKNTTQGKVSQNSKKYDGSTTTIAKQDNTININEKPLSNSEKPGVSVISNPSHSIISTCLVVCLPLPVFLLTSPDSITSLLKIAFISVDLPTPELPANTHKHPLNSSFSLSIPTPSFADTQYIG